MSSLTKVLAEEVRKTEDCSVSLLCATISKKKGCVLLVFL